MPFNDTDKQELVALLKEVITEVVEAHPLTDDEVKWVRMAIEAEAKRAAFRQAVIDKTLIGLLSALGIGIVMYAVEMFKNHWK